MNAKPSWPIFATVMCVCIVGILALHSLQNGVTERTQARLRVKQAISQAADQDQFVQFVIKPILQVDAPVQIATAEPTPELLDAIEVPQSASEAASLGSDNETFEIDVEQVKLAAQFASAMARTAAGEGSFALPGSSIVQSEQMENVEQMEKAEQPNAVPQVAKAEAVPAKLTSFRKRPARHAEWVDTNHAWPKLWGHWTQWKTRTVSELSRATEQLSPVRQFDSIRRTLTGLRKATISYWTSQPADSLPQSEVNPDEPAATPDAPQDNDADEHDADTQDSDESFIELHLDNELDGILGNSFEGFIVTAGSAEFGCVQLVDYIVVIPNAESADEQLGLMPVYEEYPGEEIVIAVGETSVDEELDFMLEMEEFGEGDINIALNDDSDLPQPTVNRDETSVDQQRRFAKYRQRVRSIRDNRREARRERLNVR